MSTCVALPVCVAAAEVRERMAHAARAHVTWMSAVIIVAVTVSCLTWLIVSKEIKVRIINDTSVADMFQVPASGGHCLFKVKKTNTYSDKAEHLTWEEMWCTNISLDESKLWMTVQQAGVYLVYVQLTYSLRNSSRNTDLSLLVEFSYAGGEEEITGAFDTRQPAEEEQDAHLSKFFLLQMKAGNRLSIKAHPKERLKYDDVRPFSSYVTIVRYADWSD